jgi:ketopantoate reductase
LLFKLVGLKSYFIQSCGPSTRASAICHHENNGEGDTHVQHDNGEEDALVQEDSGEEDNGPEVEGIITEFNSDHIISDP